MKVTTDLGIQGKGILAAARLFGAEYVKSHIHDACASLTSQPVDGCLEHFLGFESADNLWTVYAYMALNINTGDVQFLDYRLPDGTRMEDPLKRVRLS